MRILRPQEIPEYVAEGLFDLGITGRDWIEETASAVTSLGELRYSKATSRPIRVVLAVAEDSPVRRVEDLPSGVRVSTEYPGLTRRFLAAHGVDAEVRISHGATEAKIPEIADAVVEITETGRALRAAGLRIVDTILESYTELIANPASYADDAKRHAMEQLLILLNGTLDRPGAGAGEAQRGGGDLEAIIGLLPAMKSPTVSKLFGEDGVRGGGGRAQVRHQHPDPRPQGPRRDRHHRAADRQDRAVSSRSRAVARWPPGRRRQLSGTVVTFDGASAGDEVRGRGEFRRRFPFHCTQICGRLPEHRRRRRR